MIDFEIRYNAIERACLMMFKELAHTAATLQDDPQQWLKDFEASAVKSIEDVRSMDGTQPDPNVTRVATSFVNGVVKLAERKLTQR